MMHGILVLPLGSSGITGTALNNAEPLDTAHPKLRVDDGAEVDPHAACADRVRPVAGIARIAAANAASSVPTSAERFPFDRLARRTLAIDVARRSKPADHGIEIIFYLKHIETNPWLVHSARGPQLDPTARLWMERPHSNGKAIDRPSGDSWEPQRRQIAHRHADELNIGAVVFRTRSQKDIGRRAIAGEGPVVAEIPSRCKQRCTVEASSLVRPTLCRAL